MSGASRMAGSDLVAACRDFTTITVEGMRKKENLPR